MKTLVTVTLALLFAASAASAATLEGRIVNGTTSESARADEVAVYDVTRPSAEPVARLSDVEGEFSIADLPDAAAAHFRIEVRRGDQTFTQPVTSFDEPMEVYVYDTTDERGDVALLRHHVIFTRDPEHIQVTEFLEFDNRSNPPRLIRASAAPMRLHLDHEIHGEYSASIMGTAVPVDVALVDTDERGIKGIDTDLQPGPTRLVVRYLLHEENGGLSWSTDVLYPTEDRRIMVSPTDIQVEAAEMIPTESSIDGYAAWQGLAAEPGDEWTVSLSGGSAVAAGDDHDHGGEAEAASAFTEIVARPNRLTESRNLIFLGLGGMLLFGTLGVLLSGRRNPQPTAGPDPDRIAVSKVADRYVSGEISREEYEREAARLLQKKKPGRRKAPVAQG